MITAEDLESYMVKLDLDYRVVQDNLWVVRNEAARLDAMIVSLIEPIVLFEIRVADLPEGPSEALFRRLLELNATDMMHGAYGIDGNSIVMIDTLQSENLDLNEFQASFESMSLSLMQHLPTLKELLLGNNGQGADR